MNYLSNNLDLSRQGKNGEHLVLWYKRRYQGNDFVLQCDLTPKNKYLAYVTFGFWDENAENLSVEDGGLHLSPTDYEHEFVYKLERKFCFGPNVAKRVYKDLKQMLDLALSGVREEVN